MLPNLTWLRELSMLSALVRLVVAMVLGDIMGLERGLKKRPAGFRTYMLVCVGAALVMVTSQYIVNYFGSTDPARLGAQVISGIGFLGAGTIIVTGRNQVKGLTTAAGLWAAACMGLAVGIGYVEIAVLGFLLMYAALTLFHKLDVFLVGRSRVLELVIEFQSMDYFGYFASLSKERGFKISNLELVKNEALAKGNVTAILTLVLKNRGTHAQTIGMLSTLEGIVNIEEIL